MRARRLFLIVTMGLLLSSGCGKKKVEVTQFPRWEFQNYRRLAVLPIQTTSAKASEAALQMEYALVDQLTASGAFEVLPKSDVADVLTEQDFSRLADVVDPSTALPEGKLMAAQALVVGKITDFDLDKQRKEFRVPRYARDREGRIIRDRKGRPRVVGEDVFFVYRHVARVGGHVRVIDAATGRVLLSHTVPPLEADKERRGAPPEVTPEELAVLAGKSVAIDFARRIAPQRIRVSLDEDNLLVALDYFEGEYEDTDKVPISLDEFLVVVRDLPGQTERNHFRVAVAEEDGRQNLIEHEFVWSRNLGNRGEVLVVPVELLRATGAEKFEAKLYVAGNDAPVVKRDFELDIPDEDD